ncbi:MAG: Asp23/Gls24 family envelope stress response protein [Candidatus Omnitrophota bacterium]
MKDKNQTDLGAIKIHKQVIASVAKHAALEVEGVKTVGKKFEMFIHEILGIEKILSGIKIDIEKNEDVKIEIGIIVKYGHKVSEVASNVQDNILKMAEKMLDINLKEVNVNILGIEKEDK